LARAGREFKPDDGASSAIIADFHKKGARCSTLTGP